MFVTTLLTDDNQRVILPNSTIKNYYVTIRVE
ncbi:hypothetical protein ACPV47_07145 [Vibrio jasicida]